MATNPKIDLLMRDTPTKDAILMSRAGEEGRGPWMQAYPARKFYPADVRREDVHVDNVVHALPFLCRYGGHTKRFYSVAQHSILIARWLKDNGYDDETCLKGLFHDGSEGYLVDMPRPIKPLIPEYYAIEKAVQSALLANMGLSDDMPKIIKEADSLILYDEGHALFDERVEDWPDKFAPGLGVEIPGEESFAEQRRQFCALYKEFAGEVLCDS